MSHVPHELSEEFPDQQELIQSLKAENAHFAKLVDEYHAVNRTVHRAETKVEPVEELHEQQLRKQRMALKDEIAGMLSAAASA